MKRAWGARQKIALPSPYGLTISHSFCWTPGVTGVQLLTWNPKGG
jgi:hypothetical protein